MTMKLVSVIVPTYNIEKYIADGNGSAPVVRREVFDAICYQDNLHGSYEDCYFDENFRQSEDIECWFRIAAYTSWEIEGISETLTLYRVNGEGLSANVIKQLDSWEQFISKHHEQSASLMAEWESPARAYQLRYLARRAIRLKDPIMAVKLINQALATHWLIIFSEPNRTVVTIVAAYLLKLLPSSLYTQFESSAIKMTSFMKQIRISDDRFKLNYT